MTFLKLEQFMKILYPKLVCFGYHFLENLPFLMTVLRKFNICTCELMILGQLRMGARQAKNAPLYKKFSRVELACPSMGLGGHVGGPAEMQNRPPDARL